MKKSTKLLSAISATLLIIVGFLCFSYSVRVPKAIAMDMWAFKFPDKYEQYTTIKCDPFDITKPEFVFVDKMPDRDLELMFYNVKTRALFTKEINLNYTGGTDIKNTTFPELVEMVREDCGQFQQSKGDRHDENMNWSYSEYIPDPPKLPELELEPWEEDFWNEWLEEKRLEEMESR